MTTFKVILQCPPDAAEQTLTRLREMLATLGAGVHARVAEEDPADTIVDQISPFAADDLKSELRDLEKRRIVDALEQHAGNQTLAARSLGISRRTLLNRLDDFDIPRPRKQKR